MAYLFSLDYENNGWLINILSGQYVLLILKLGYFTNTTYGYIKWGRYINTHKEDNSLF